jgi:hypothetical protein
MAIMAVHHAGKTHTVRLDVFGVVALAVESFLDLLLFLFREAFQLVVIACLASVDLLVDESLIISALLCEF